MKNTNNVLEVKNLKLSYFISSGEVQALRDISFCLRKGETLGIVGESGSGKSVTAQSIMGLIPFPQGRILAGSIVYGGEELTVKTEKEYRNLRGREMGMIFQDPGASLTPVITVGKQISEVLRIHQNLSWKEAKLKALELLDMVGIEAPEKCWGQYPHELSGGMCQRVMIAAALASRPAILIADEPTTALDVTTQGQILALLKDLTDKFETSVIFLTHDLSIVAGFCNRVVVLCAGEVMEEGNVKDIFYNPQHPYLQGLLKSVESISGELGSVFAPIKGLPPNPMEPPEGCVFYPRCEKALDKCKKLKPPRYKLNEDHFVSCWLCEN